ncbi:hypothetical protein AOLI_G00165640 [Acnodon oligacanthus]
MVWACSAWAVSLKELPSQLQPFPLSGGKRVWTLTLTQEEPRVLAVAEFVNSGAAPAEGGARRRPEDSAGEVGEFPLSVFQRSVQKLAAGLADRRRARACLSCLPPSVRPFDPWMRCFCRPAASVSLPFASFRLRRAGRRRAVPGLLAPPVTDGHRSLSGEIHDVAGQTRQTDSAYSDYCSSAKLHDWINWIARCLEVKIRGNC